MPNIKGPEAHFTGPGTHELRITPLLRASMNRAWRRAG
jgi:hypothetical protein